MLTIYYENSQQLFRTSNFSTVLFFLYANLITLAMSQLTRFYELYLVAGVSDSSTYSRRFCSMKWARNASIRAVCCQPAAIQHCLQFLAKLRHHGAIRT